MSIGPGSRTGRLPRKSLSGHTSSRRQKHVIVLIFIETFTGLEDSPQSGPSLVSRENPPPGELGDPTPADILRVRTAHTRTSIYPPIPASYRTYATLTRDSPRMFPHRRSLDSDFILTVQGGHAHRCKPRRPRSRLGVSIQTQKRKTYKPSGRDVLAQQRTPHERSFSTL